MQIDLASKKCGMNRFVLPQGGGDEGIVTCGECGHVIGSMGALKEAFASAVINGEYVAKLGDFPAAP